MAEEKKGSGKTWLLVAAAAVVGYALWSMSKKSAATKTTSTSTGTQGGQGAAASIVNDLAGLGKSIASAFGKSSGDSSGTASTGTTQPVDVTQGTVDTSGSKYGSGGSGYFSQIDSESSGDASTGTSDA